MTAEIGFLIIGAPKAGTTSLFEYMRAHPQIHMPAEKEIYFFNIDRNYRRGWDWYVSTVSHDAPLGAVCGEATTEYMSGVPYDDAASDGQGPSAWSNRDRRALEELIPRRIHKALPDVKLICVLRDPVKRAYSHYRMMALGNVESRPFEEVIEELLEPGTLEQTRVMRSRVNGYVVNGEYSRLLDGFLRVFPREQLKVIFSDDLSMRPADTLADVFDFVGVSADFVPGNVSTRYRAAAVRQRIPGLNLVTWQTRMARVRAARTSWHALPDRMRCRIDRAYNVANHRLEMWNALRGVVAEDIPAASHERLATHFRPDSEALGEMLGRDIPWLASWTGS
jgi:hypothetical protein